MTAATTEPVTGIADLRVAMTVARLITEALDRPHESPIYEQLAAAFGDVLSVQWRAEAVG